MLVWSPIWAGDLDFFLSVLSSTSCPETWKPILMDVSVGFQALWRLLGSANKNQPAGDITTLVLSQ